MGLARVLFFSAEVNFKMSIAETVQCNLYTFENIQEVIFTGKEGEKVDGLFKIEKFTSLYWPDKVSTKFFFIRDCKNYAEKPWLKSFQLYNILGLWTINFTFPLLMVSCYPLNFILPQNSLKNLFSAIKIKVKLNLTFKKNQISFDLIGTKLANGWHKFTSKACSILNSMSPFVKSI